MGETQQCSAAVCWHMQGDYKLAGLQAHEAAVWLLSACQLDCTLQNAWFWQPTYTVMHAAEAAFP